MGQDTPRKRRTKAAPAPQILLKADTVSITLSGEKDGKTRVRSASWEEPVVLLPGQKLEARNQGGQVVLLRQVAE